MPPLYLTGLMLLFFFSDTSNKGNTPERVYLTCYGYNPCSACTSCNYCKHCKVGGGTCGICKPGKQVSSKKDTTAIKPLPAYTPKETYSSQCRATTKKGTWCSRSARSNGYCWQHGG